VPGNGDSNEVVASQLEVAILDRARDHRTFRRIRTTRLDELIGESRALTGSSGTGSSGTGGAGSPAGSNAPADSGPPTGPGPSNSDRGSGLGDGTPPNPA
jgi:proteasome alpha subunit